MFDDYDRHDAKANDRDRNLECDAGYLRCCDNGEADRVLVLVVKFVRPWLADNDDFAP